MNLALTLLAAAERHGEGEALVDGELRLDYAALQRRAAEVAGGLAELGLKQGDPLCVLLGNGHQTVELYWAAQWMGARFVPLNFRLSPDEVRYCVEDAGAAVVAFEQASAEAAAACASAGVKLLDIGENGEADARMDDFDGEAHAGALDLDESEISLMLYTSGTTGKPKGVPRSHRADRAAGLSEVIHHGYRHARSLARRDAALPHDGNPHDDRDGADRRLLRDDAPMGCGDGARLIAGERISSLYLAPTLFHDLLDGLPDDADLSSVESIGYAGSPMGPELAARCVDAFDARVFFNHYGSTEYYTWTIGHDQAQSPAARDVPRSIRGCGWSAPTTTRPPTTWCRRARRGR